MESTLVDAAKGTGNDLIILVVVLMIGLVFTVPSVIAYIKAKSKEKQERHHEAMERSQEVRAREDKLLDIVQGNTSVLTELTTLLKSNNQNCAECRLEQNGIYKRILDKQEHIHMDVIKIKERNGHYE